jgi:hypothetical protein
MMLDSEPHVPADLLSKKSPGTNPTGGWLVPRAGMGGCGEEKVLWLHRGFEPHTLEPVTSRYVDYATLAPGLTYILHLQVFAKVRRTLAGNVQNKDPCNAPKAASKL